MATGAGSMTRTAGLGLALLLAACSGEKAATSAQAPPPAAPAQAPAAPLPAAVPARPEGADPVDAALSAVQAFNAKAALDLVDVSATDRKLHDLAGRASDLARRAGSDAGAGGRLPATRKEAEAAHKRLVDGLAAFTTEANAQTAAVGTALEPCAKAPELAAYAGCAALTGEQALLAQNVDAVTKAYAAAEAAWPQVRAQLDEASATVALSR